MSRGHQIVEQAVQRGIERLWDPRVWGTIIGATGASVFVNVNRGALGSAWSTVALLTWVVAMVAYLAAVFAVARHFPRPETVRPSAGLVYLASCAGMLAFIAVGGWVLRRIDAVPVVPAVIVTAVGLHFLPFASAFHADLFRRLGLVMTVLGIVGIVLGLAWTPTAAAAVAVLTGVVMLAFIAEDAWRGHAR